MKIIQLIVFFSTTIYCQSQSIPYQAIIRNSLGMPLTSKDVQLKISLLDSISTGTILYIESHQTSSNFLGLISIQIGSGEVIQGNYNSIDWSKNVKFLKVEIDTTDKGNNFIDMGTQQLSSVPYALYAANGLPNGVAKGELLYWDGNWKKLIPGQKGQTLRIGENGLPEWFGKSYTLGEVYTSTPSATDILSTSANLGGVLRFDGNTDQLSVGICWSVSPSPTYELNSKFEEPKPQDSIFISTISGLLPGRTYYARAFVVTPMGISYGNEISFITPQIDILTGLIAYFPFDGNTQDYSGNGFNGISNGIGFGTDRNGNLNKSGVFSSAESSHLFITANTQIQPASYTVSAWVNTDVIQYGGLGLGKEQYVVAYLPVNWSKGTAFSIALGATDNSILSSQQWTSSTGSQGFVTPSGFIKTNQWYHFTATYDSKTGLQKFYINGNLYGEINSILSYEGLKGFCIGATTENLAGQLYGFFQGRIDEVRYYSRALNAIEVSYLANQ